MASTHNEMSGSSRTVVQAGAIGGPVTINEASLPPMPAYLRDPQRWPLARSWDPLAAGAHRARPGPDDDGVPPYVERDIDDALRARLTAASDRGGLVLVRGHSASGKTRTAFEALRSVLPEHRVITPTTGVELPMAVEAIDRARVPSVLWLDNLEGYLGFGGLDPNLLAECERLRLPVLATIRVREFQIFDPATRGAHLIDDDPMRRQTARIGAQALGRTDPIDLPRVWSQEELHRTKASDDERIADAVEHHGTYGVAEYLAAGPAIWSEWRSSADVDGAPRGAALVEAAVDLARTGLSGPYSLGLLVELHEHYLAERGGHLLRPESLEDALAWAARVRLGITSPLLPAGDDRWYVFDYLVDRIQRLPIPIPVPDFVWAVAAENAADPDDRMNIAAHAAEAETVASYQVAEALWQPMVTAGVGLAAYNLGVLCLANDRVDEARTLFRQSAEDGIAIAAFNLGHLLEKDGEEAEGRKWIRQAADSGLPNAMWSVAFDLEQQGKLEEAKQWYQRSAELGDHRSATNLGNLLNDEGLSDEAQRWYHEAEKASDLHATHNIGVFHHQAGRLDEAERWYRLAVERGAGASALNLGIIAEKSGRRSDAERWYRRAVELEDFDGALNLGILLEEDGREDEAATWYQQAAEAGHGEATRALCRLLVRSDRLGDAASWMARAAEAGDIEAAAGAGDILLELGRVEEAIPHLTAAAEAGHRDAAYNLGVVCVRAGKLDDAKRWYRQAAEDGDAEAAEHLADVLLADGRIAPAVWWTRRARALRADLVDEPVGTT